MKKFPLIVLSLLVACGGQPLDEDDDDDGGGLSIDNPADGDGISPFIIDGEMICNPGTTSPDTLNVVVSAGDPQGADTLDSDGWFNAYSSSGEVFIDALLMPCSTSGQCTAGFTVTDYPGLDCSSAYDYTFTAVVMDEEGNVSSPGEVRYTGR